MESARAYVCVYMDRDDNVLHASGAGPVVAIVEVEAFALEDECANAILVEWLECYSGELERWMIYLPGPLRPFVSPLLALFNVTVIVSTLL